MPKKEVQIESFLNAHAERQSAIERDLAATDQRIVSLDEKTDLIISQQSQLFSKFDNLMTAVSTIKAGSGLISSQMILTTIGVLTPIIVATSTVGYFFVLQTQEKDALRFKAQRELALERFHSAENEVRLHRSKIEEGAIVRARLEERISFLKDQQYGRQRNSRN